MAIVLSDRVKETTITQGTGSITLGGALGGFVSFADGIGDNNETYYVIENDANFEVGMGTYSSGSLSRDTVLASSNSGSKISLNGVSFVFCTLPADKALFKDGAGDVAVNHLTASGNVTVSGMLTMKTTSAGNFFHAYKEGTNPTIALYSDGGSSPEWKLGIKDNPNSDTAPPTYAYVHAEDGNIGLYANSVNKLSLTHGGGLTLVNNGNTIFTSATTTGTSFIGQGAAYPTLILQAATSQSANIQEWRNSAGSVLSCVDNNGRIGIKTDDPDYALDVAGNIGLNEYIYHNGDSNTYIRFRGDQIDFNAGGRNFLSLDEASQDECVVNTGGNDIDFRVEGENFTHLIFTDAASDRVGIGTSSPSYLLDVAGVGSFQTVRFSDGTTQTSAGLPVGSGSLIQKNALDIISVSGLTTAGIDALPHASGYHLLSEIQANSASGASSASNISTNSTTIIASGNANLALINSNTTNISTNASQIIASGNRNESQINNVSGYQVYLVNASGNSNRDLSNLNTVAINSSGNINKDYTASVSGWASSSFGGGSANSGDVLANSASGVAISGYNSAYTDIKVAALVDSAPDTLNTLNELAAAINDDASISTTLTNLITSNTTAINASGNTNKDLITSNTTAINASGNSNKDAITSNTNLAIASGNKAYDTSVAASLPIGSGAKIQLNTANISTNATNLIASGNKGSALAIAASLPVGSGAKIQANAGNISTNATNLIASGNKAHDTAIAVALTYAISSGNRALEVASGLASAGGLAVGSGAKIQANTANISTNSTAIIASGNANHASIATNTSNISTNATNLIASGNKAYDTAIAASLTVGSGAKIQANAGNITSNTNLINSSGNKAYDTAVAASLPVGSGSKIQTNASNITSNTTAINASGNSNKDLITANTTAINASGNSNKDYTAAVSGYAVAYTDISITDAGGYSNWKIADGTAAGDAISNGETLNVSGVSGVNTDYTGNLLKIAAVGLSGYSQSYTDIKVAALVDSAPDTLNTLNEIAAAIDDDANIATTLTNLIVSSGNANRDLAIASGNKANDTAVASSLPVGSGAKIQANAASITSNTNLVNSSGNKAYDTAIAASLPVGSGAKIQANAANITSNTNLVNSSGNKAYDTAVAASLPVGSGAKIQVNVGNISTNATDLIASGNKAHDTAVAASLPVASGSKIQVNAGNITSNTNLINSSGNKAYDTAVAASLAVGSGAKIQANELGLIASGNKAYDTAIAASLPVGSGAKIQANTANISTNATNLIASGNKAYDTAIAVALTYAISSGNRALEVASGLASGGGGGSFNNFTLTADGGSNQTIADGNTLDIAGGNGITTAVGATDTVTVNVDAAQTTITSVYNASLKMGRDSQNLIDFATTDNKIILRANDVNQVSLIDNVFGPEADSDVDLGTSAKRWKDAYVDSITTTDKITAGGSINQAYEAGSLSSNVLSFDCSKSNYFEATVNAVVNGVTFTNATAGQRIILLITNSTSDAHLSDGNGWDTIIINGTDAAGGADVKWAGGIEPTLTANGKDMYGIVFTSTVTTAYGFIIGQDIKA